MSDPQPDARFESAKALFIEGLGGFEAGHFEAAERCYLASLALLPDRVSTLVNLAATQLELARPGEALAVAGRILALEPDNVDAWFHRANALGLLARHADALASFERVLALDAQVAPAWLRHGQTLQSLDRHADALASYERALAIDPELALAWSNRGGILRDMLRLDEAADAFRRAIACGADPELTGYFLASVGAQQAPPSAPARYVQTLFDDYAGQFDAHLVGMLRYRAHTVLIEALETLARGRFASALDLGCGTGLCGALVRPQVGHLTGVDLSAAMLDKARSLGVYDHLVQADLVDALGAADRSYDLVLAADVFIYIGELSPVFAAVHAAMNRGGVFCFSAEPAGRDDAGFELLPSLRYAHSERYLRVQAARHGFEVAALWREPIREDQRRSVEGLFACLIRR